MQLSNEKLIELVQGNIYPREHLEALYNQNKPLMVTVIQRTLKGGASSELTDELLQECYIILCDCVKNFDLKQGVKFSSYFVKAITWGIYKYTLTYGAKIKIPAYIISLAGKYKKLCNDGVTDKEMLRILNIKAPELDLIKIALSSAISLDTPLQASENESITVGDTIADASSVFENDVINKADDRILYNLCKSILKSIEFDVIKLRYWYNLTYSNIARQTGKSLQSIYTIRQQALRKLKNNNRIKDYYADYLYKSVGVAEFARTHTSTVERYILRKLDVERLCNMDNDNIKLDKEIIELENRLNKLLESDSFANSEYKINKMLSDKQ